MITPCLDRRSQLEGLIGCVRAQTYTDIELIVIDGGSSDGTQDLLRLHDDDPNLRWLSEPDDGVYSAVNKGLRLAEGDIVAYLNTDDRYFAHSVETAVRCLVEHPEAGFVYGDLLRWHLEEDVGELTFYPPFSSGYLRRGRLISQPTVFLRRSLVAEAGFFDESFRLAADIDYWARAARIGSGRKIDEVLAFETWHEGRLTAGTEAADLAHAELDRIRSRAVPDGSVRGKSLRVVDAARAALSDRVCRVRLLLGLLTGRTRAWEGFRTTSFRVDIRRLVLSLVPVVGRKHRLCVSVSGPGPWPELEELGSR